MKAGHMDESSNRTGVEELSAAHYHAAAARTRKLHAEATTPRLKQYLRQLITRFEGLAGDVQTESGFS
jgi:hypothetical protein